MDELEKLKIENEKLRKISENKSDVISITAHQLRTSLSALKWIFKMFIDGDVGKLSNEQSELAKKGFDSNERMLTLVNDLLTMNHTDEVEIHYEFKKMDILEIAEQTIFDFSGETNKKGIELIFLKPEAPLPLVSCDREMIRVVFQNLIENGIKYSHPGGKVFLSFSQKEKELQISVHDSGIGITNEDKESIFQKFYRAPNAIQKDNVGSGLGLFTTKNIVEKHGGKIWFENVDGGGTTFFVTLPIT
jgi:signal transduction histidine kinase